jgi:hypothetical protein
MATTADDTLDLAARLSRIKALCDRLLAERANGAEVRIIAERIGAEIDATHAALQRPKP